LDAQKTIGRESHGKTTKAIGNRERERSGRNGICKKIADVERDKKYSRVKKKIFCRGKTKEIMVPSLGKHHAPKLGFKRPLGAGEDQ